MLVVATEAKKPAVASTAERLQEAVDLPDDTWRQVHLLANQLDGRPLLPVIGAGTSFDCDVELAGAVAERMFQRFVEDGGSESMREDLEKDCCGKFDLGAVADALYIEGGQERVIRALGLDKRDRWRDKDEFPEHFCAYRVLARLAREGFVSEALTLNYDCAFERGLHDEGFQFEPWTFRGRDWLDHATVITGGADHVRLERRGELVLTKAHGCAAAYRKSLRKSLEDGRIDLESQEAIIVRRSQLLDWRSDLWARDLFSDRARRHVILLLGISGEDPVVHISLTRVLQEVYGYLNHEGTRAEPRVVAIDRSPGTVALTSLVHQGCGRATVGEGLVTSIEVPSKGSLTAVLTALATEMLAHRLVSEGALRLPSREDRVAVLMVSVPVSMRWTYLLERRRKGVEYAQRINLERVKERGYVPLCTDFERVAGSLKVRRKLRSRLGMEADETIEEALRYDGFVVSPHRGSAYMPLGIGVDELRSMSRIDLRRAADCFATPHDLEAVVVAADADGFVARSAETGKEVSLP